MAHANGKRDPSEMSIDEMFLATADFEYTADTADGAMKRTVREGRTNVFEWTPGGADAYTQHMALALKRVDEITTDPGKCEDPAAALREIRAVVEHLKTEWLIGGQ